LGEPIYKSYFNPRSVAERYFEGRPRYHPFVIEKICEFLKIGKPVARTLDVGCGTGFSSVALKDISEIVVGCDLSAEMLGHSEDAPSVEYSVASGEYLPFSTSEFDLITVAQAVHWMDREKFFAESERVLKTGCPMIAYDNYFQGRIFDEPRFNDWYKESFLKKFPTPSRNRLPFKKESDDPNELVLVNESRYENSILLSQQELVNYLITITNVINVVEKGQNSIEDVSKYLSVEIEEFFEGVASREFLFSAPIWYFKRSGEL